MRADLPPDIPETMKKLPLDERGYPVPWFVMWIKGKPEFRSADADKWALAIADHRCWVCGERIRGVKAFVIGPMCAVNKNTSEPPCHVECAEWSVRACPFMVKPQMVRRRKEGDAFERLEKEHGQIAGLPIDRNPGVSCVWVTYKYRVYRDPAGGKLVRLGDPEWVSFWCEGRKATWEEIDHSIQTGLPLLRQVAFTKEENDAIDEAANAVYEKLATPAWGGLYARCESEKSH